MLIFRLSFFRIIRFLALLLIVGTGPGIAPAKANEIVIDMAALESQFKQCTKNTNENSQVIDLQQLLCSPGHTRTEEGRCVVADWRQVSYWLGTDYIEATQIEDLIRVLKENNQVDEEGADWIRERFAQLQEDHPLGSLPTLRVIPKSNENTSPAAKTLGQKFQKVKLVALCAMSVGYSVSLNWMQQLFDL